MGQGGEAGWRPSDVLRRRRNTAYRNRTLYHNKITRGAGSRLGDGCALAGSVGVYLRSLGPFAGQLAPRLAIRSAADSAFPSPQTPSPPLLYIWPAQIEPVTESEVRLGFGWGPRGSTRDAGSQCDCQDPYQLQSGCICESERGGATPASMTRASRGAEGKGGGWRGRWCVVQ